MERFYTQNSYPVAEHGENRKKNQPIYSILGKLAGGENKWFTQIKIN
jgi:hypothetical protein